MRRWSGHAVTLALFAVACSTEPAPKGSEGFGSTGGANPSGGGGEASESRLVIATGQQDVEPWPEDGWLTLHRGCQGLQHIYVSLVSSRFDGTAPWLVSLSLLRNEDEELVSIPFEVQLRPSRMGAGVWGLVGLTLVVPYPEDALEMPLTLEASVEDGTGRLATTSIATQVAWGADHCGGH